MPNTSINNDNVDWFKSSYSGGNGACVETAHTVASHGIVPIRDSKMSDSPIINTSPEAFAAFVKMAASL